MRTIRKTIELGTPILGMVTVFAAVLLIPPPHLQLQLVVVLVGVLLIEAGVWGLTNPFLPNERQFLPLREEVDDFIDLVRQLNAAAIEKRSGREGAEADFDENLADLHSSVRRMGQLAGGGTDEGPSEPIG
ncbi:MAG: hypothetical protein BMS9Abin29_2049 [Gemmatimonadota bacterium]|nr:MAG: hypothetical protein BMS9Abin29_2049 [Gemmatimonadota bacterium]